MRQYTITLAIIFLLLSGTTKAQYVPLPTGPFVNWMANNYPGSIMWDINFNAFLDTTNVAMRSAQSVSVSGLVNDGLPALLNMTYFVSCTSLSIGSCYLDGAIFPPNLRYFSWIGNESSVPYVPAGVEKFICTGNQWLSSLPALPASLKYLDCRGNYLSSVSIAGTNVDTLYCGAQHDYAPFNNLLTSVTLNTSIKVLDCSDGRLSSLPALPNTLRYLNCSYQAYHTNPEDIQFTLTSLPAHLPDSLRYLNCGSNKLSVIPELPPYLVELHCAGTRYFNPGGAMVSSGITALPELPSTLQTLDCRFSNMYCLPHLPASLLHLLFDIYMIGCLPNSGNYTVDGLSAGQYPPPLCTFLNNTYNCVVNPVISGRFFYDNNSNGILDPGENYKANVKVQVSTNGYIAYSGNGGYFEVTGDYGSNNLQIFAPNYYAAVPSSISYNFSSYDTITYNLIALQPTANVDSVSISLVPYGSPVPGNSFGYELRYENLGTTIVSPNTVLNFDATRLNYTSASNPNAIQSGNTVSLAETNFTPGEIRHFLVYFTVNTTAQQGDIVTSSAVITASTAVATSISQSIVVSSFDPNDIQVTPTLDLQQVSNGEYMNYLIRFQNTGTAPAQNIRVMETLHPFVDPASVQIIGSSHICKVKQVGKDLLFQFDDIWLPTLATSEPLSHGYIRFRVRPQSNVTAGTIIPAWAAIYFDFNSPVNTNLDNTLILASLPLNLLSFNGYYNSSESKAMLTWKTANEMNTHLFEIERSKDGQHFSNAGYVNAAGTGSRTYGYKLPIQNLVEYYRLKMVDIDGKFTLSNIITVRAPKPGVQLAVINNPVKGSIFLEVYDPSLKNTKATITNNLGQVVYSFILNSGQQFISTTKLTPGIYYLQTIAGTKTILVE